MVNCLTDGGIDAVIWGGINATLLPLMVGGLSNLKYTEFCIKIYWNPTVYCAKVYCCTRRRTRAAPVAVYRMR